MKVITCIAPVNIAVVKYWGKRDVNLILPINDSISATLTTEHMCAKTTIMISKNFKENRLWLNGKEEDFDNPRLSNCIKEIKRRTQLKELLHGNLHICSENNFPTAAGLASSAAGYACLVYALAALYDIQTEISSIARRGSGSACRSIYGGWVRWQMGTLDDGTDSIAKQIVPENYWPEMRILILVVNENRKKCSSSSGMQRSVETSECLKYRADKLVPKHVDDMIKAIEERTFDKFAEITMRESNQFHAMCLDTYPPCVYMNDLSHAIVELIHTYNTIKGTNKVAYTFDAGPNACLYLLENDVPEVLSVINHIYPSEMDPVEYLRGIAIDDVKLTEELKSDIHLNRQPGALKYIIHTKVGDGPKILKDATAHLLNEAGLPKTC